MPDLGLLADYGANGAAAPAPAPLRPGDLGTVQDYLVNQTVFPKGQAPVQITQSKAAEFAHYDQLQALAAKRQQALASERAQARYASEQGGLQGWAPTEGMTSAARTLVNNALALPSIGRDISSVPQRAIMGAANYLTGGKVGQPYSTTTPQLNVDQLFAGIDAMTGKQPYSQGLENRDIAEGARQTVHPRSNFLGNIGGDIATIALGRLPFARGIALATASPDDILLASRSAGFRPLGTAAQNAKRQMDIWWNSKWAAPVKRGLGKVGEVGAENAMLSLAHGDDPIKSAAFGAAGQAAGSMAMTAGFRFPLAAAGLGTIGSAIVAYQMLKAENPFNARDSITKSAETVIGGMAGATVMGTIASLLGAGRFRGAGPAWRTNPGEVAPAWLSHEQARGFPKITDAINSVLRTGPNSLITHLLADENNPKGPVLGPVLDKLSKNVTLFKPDELRKISNGVQNNNLRETVIGLLKNPDFAARMAQ